MFKIIKKGKIIQGRGRSSEDLESLYNIIDTNLYKGSLNVVFNKPFFLNQDTIYKIFDSNKRYIWNIEIKNKKTTSYAYRWNGTPLHIVEIVSDSRLRKDNKNNIEEIEINFNVRDIIKTPFFSKICWYIVWWKREDWYYTNDKYVNFISKYFKYIYIFTLQRRRFIF